MARAGTGVAAPCQDGSAMFFNPAGIAGRRGLVATAGVTVVAASGSFTNDTTGLQSNLDTKPVYVPHAYVQYGFDDRWSVGLALFVPYGLGTTWPVSFEGRFSGYDNDLHSFYIQPTIAVKPHPYLSLGGGVDIAVGSVEINQRIDFFEQSVAPGTIAGQLGIPRNTEIADAELRATGATGVGAHIGILFEPSDIFSFGARYISRITLDYDGDATFNQLSTNIILPNDNPFAPGVGPVPLDNIVAGLMAPGGPLAAQGVSTSITMPDQVVAGIAVKVHSRLTVLADWQWVHWAVFDTVALDLENTASPRLRLQDDQNTNAVRLGVDWQANDRWSLRGGVLAHTKASPAETVTPLLPESDRQEFTLGLGIKLTESLSGDVAYQFVGQNERRGRMRDPLPGESPTALNAGVYAFRGHLFGITLSVRP
jgi:long-chain fatty acid transport protein